MFLETYFAAAQCGEFVIGIMSELKACFFLKKILEEQRRLKREQEEADTAARRHAGLVVTHQQFITNDRFGDLLVINEKEKRKTIEVTYFLSLCFKRSCLMLTVFLCDKESCCDYKRFITVEIMLMASYCLQRTPALARFDFRAESLK